MVRDMCLTRSINLLDEWKRSLSEEKFMKKNLKLKINDSRIIILLLVLAIQFIVPTQVYAKTSASTVKKVYKKWLTKYESKYTPEQMENPIEINSENNRYCSYFIIIDMNGDKIPELITNHWNGYKNEEVHVYTYKNGKIKELTKTGITADSTMGGSASVALCSKKHLHKENYYGALGADEVTYKLDKNYNLKKYLEYHEVFNPGSIDNETLSVNYLKNNNTISEKQYNKLIGGCNKKYSLWKQNTKKERNKI
jgi:hypothetical protein